MRPCCAIFASRRDADGRGYGAIVLASHSQGTVITADLLRFLQGQQPPDPALAVLGLPPQPLPPLPAGEGFIPVYLLTVGSPLRQLYGWRFPHLYSWAFHPGTDRWQNPATPIPADRQPVPRELRLCCWVNAYRSGDYVGRYLWRPADCDFLWEPGTESVRADGSSKEVCIGAGAHNHYFGEIEVGEYLDDLIHLACGQAAAALRYPV